MAEIDPSVKKAFDDECGRSDVVLFEVNDFDGGRRREFLFQCSGRIFAIGVKLVDEPVQTDAEIAKKAGGVARFRADRLTQEAG